MRHAKTITLTIDTSNDAFDDHEGGETARILRHLARAISCDKELPTTGEAAAMDLNGNKCGTLTIRRAD